MSKPAKTSAGAKDTKLGKRTREYPAKTEDDDEEKLKRFVGALVGTTEAPGILKPKKRPCKHQREAVKRMLKDEATRTLLVHDPGLGKTYTVLLLMAAMHAVHKGSKRELKFFISVPTSCLVQWYRAVLEDLNVSHRLIMSTNRLCDLTEENIAKNVIIIVSRDTVGRAYKTCYEYVGRNQADQPQADQLQGDQPQCDKEEKRGTGWFPIKDAKVHPLFTANFSLFAIDELHFMRNNMTSWTKAHELLASISKKVVGLTATPVFNSPKDLMGVSTAMDLPSDLKDPKHWFKENDFSRVKIDTIRWFNQYVDRADDSILSLPPITHTIQNFDVSVAPSVVEDYNNVLSCARRLRGAMERKGKAHASEMHKLMAYLQTMQQFLVAPILAECGATAAKNSPDIIERAAEVETGALKALRETIVKLREDGFKRIMVASCHTSLLRIADLYLKRNCPEAGEIMIYDGSLSQTKRTKAVDSFLGGERTIMLMSIDAGGTGLHLVPGANAVVFWGSRPFSPMQILQTSKRVHRIGQKHPVKVVHLIAKGSVDCAINSVHGDKQSLSNAVIDSNLEELANREGAWRTTGRIVNGCKFLDETGIFPEVDITEQQVEERLRMKKLAMIEEQQQLLAQQVNQQTFRQAHQPLNLQQQTHQQAYLQAHRPLRWKQQAPPQPHQQVPQQEAHQPPYQQQPQRALKCKWKPLPHAMPQYQTTETSSGPCLPQAVAQAMSDPSGLGNKLVQAVAVPM